MKIFSRCFSVISLAAILLLTPQTASANFNDVSANHKNSRAIEFLSDHKVLQGYSDGGFRPGNAVNRAEMMKILVKGLGYGNPDPDLYQKCFLDVQTEWFAPYICFAKGQGWVNGYSDGTFRPENQVNNAEALKMLLLTSQSELVSAEGEWFETYMKTAKEKDLIPDDDDTANASLPMNRASMSESIFRTIVTQSLDTPKYSDELLDQMETVKKEYEAVINKLQLTIEQLQQKIAALESVIRDRDGKSNTISSEKGTTKFTESEYKAIGKEVAVHVTVVPSNGPKKEVRFKNEQNQPTKISTSDDVSVTIPDGSTMVLPTDASSEFIVAKMETGYPAPPKGVKFESVAKVGFDASTHIQVPGGVMLEIPGIHKRIYRTSGSDAWKIDDGLCDTSETIPKLQNNQTTCIYYVNNATGVLTKELSIFAGGNDPERFIIDQNGNYEDDETGLVWYATDLNYQVWNTDETASESSIVCADNDFRVPTALEMYSLLSSEQKEGTNIYTLLPEIKASAYWTSTLFKEYDAEEEDERLMQFGKSVWTIDVTSGLRQSQKKALVLPVRCIYDSAPYNPYDPQYTAQGDDYIDNQTNLVWHGTDATASKWFEAEAACNALNGSWRLPTLIELETLIRPFDTLPHSDLPGLENDGIEDWYWSSDMADESQKAWGVSLFSGHVSQIPITETFNVRCIEQ
jgi:hypothetical protein